MNAADAPTGQGGFGLTGMAERAQAVGARIEYGPGRGQLLCRRILG